MGVEPSASLNKYKEGDIVIVRRGRYAGKLFAVVKTEGESRVYISDGRNYTVDKPKKKNVKHLQRTLMSLKDTPGATALGKTLDNGRLAEAISAVAGDNSGSSKQGG